MTIHSKSIGVLFDEGDKYLLVKLLGAGTTSQVTSVRSQKDGRIYVRKRAFKPESMQLKENVPSEAWITRKLGPHQLIPFVAEAYESPPAHWSIIFQLCNGGDLTRFMLSHAEALKPIPEAAIWHFYAQGVSALAFLHHGWREGKHLPSNWDTVLHGDIKEANVFLDYPRGSEIPNVMLGDFGFATHRPNYDFREPAHDSLGINHWSGDIFRFARILLLLLVTANPSEDPDSPIRVPFAGFVPEQYWKNWEDFVREFGSEKLCDWIIKLGKENAEVGLPTALELAETLIPVAHEQIARLPPASWDWTRPEHTDKPDLSPEYRLPTFDDDTVESNGPPPRQLIEPYFFVNVDAETFDHGPINLDLNKRAKRRHDRQFKRQFGLNR